MSFNVEDLILNFLIIILSIFQMIPVAANDVAFSIHAVLLTAITLFQIAIYEVKMIFFSRSEYCSCFYRVLYD
jgi:hypothetical protein